MELDPSPVESRESSKAPPEATGSDLSKVGSHLVSKFHVLMRVSQIYDTKNVTFRQFSQETVQTINALIQEGTTLSIKILQNEILLNNQRLRYAADGFMSFKYVLTHWKKKLIGSVTFAELVDERVLHEFISIFNSLEDGRKDNATHFTQRLAGHGIHSVNVTPLEESASEKEDTALEIEDHKEVARKVFFEAIGTVKESMTRIKANQYPNMRKLKRLVQRTIRLVVEDESILLGLTTIKNYDEYTYNHCVNVSIYALGLGRRLGFPRETLTELALTALFHDVGKSRLPKEVLNKPAALNDEEWALMKKHPLTGVETILNLKALGDINPRMVIGIFDHHLRGDGSGYPKLFRKKEISLFGRIIQIADVYDAMTTPRVYRKAWTPEQALAFMLRDRGKHLDPILLKIFIGLVGIFPIGSLVLLTTGELGIVLKPNAESKWMDRPQVILISQDEKGYARKELADLTATNGGNQFKRTIVKTLDPNQYHIDITKYFV
jgi:HD-GYP domain-containing protein (c-di-GMP phosphodiesterase class II)